MAIGEPAGPRDAHRFRQPAPATLTDFARIASYASSQVQLIVAFLFSLVYLLLVSVAMPYKDEVDDYFAKACSFGLSAFFCFALVLKVRRATLHICHSHSHFTLPSPTLFIQPCT